jgi:hypothetical protein
MNTARRQWFTTLACAVGFSATAFAEGAPMHPASSSSSVQSMAGDAPPEARQLWSELYCMCGECEHEMPGYLLRDRPSPVRPRVQGIAPGSKQ